MSLRGLYLDFQHKASTINDHDTLVVIGLPSTLVIQYTRSSLVGSLYVDKTWVIGYQIL